jgi:hypothetical protein
MLKTETIKLKSGEEIEITELNALAQIEMLEAQRDLNGKPEASVNFRLAAIACARCVNGWGTDPEEVLKTRTLDDILEAGSKITDLSDLSGSKRKNSASVTSVSSRSA